MDQQQQRPRSYAQSQDGTPVMEPISHVEMELPTDPKRLVGGTIKIYHRDPEVMFQELERYAQRYMTLLDTINAARRAGMQP